MEKQPFKHIIFDLGGVIVNIHLQRAFKAFATLTGFAEDDLHNIAVSSEVVKHFEKGLLSSNAFRNSLRQIFRQDTPNKELDAAWNQAILDIPHERLGLLDKLSKRYQLFLLSNTNPIHLKAVHEALHKASGVKELHHFFTKTYYSFQTGHLKPEARAFKAILYENRLMPEETLFIDDTIANIKAARSLHIHTLHVHTPSTLFDYFAHEAPPD